MRKKMKIRILASLYLYIPAWNDLNVKRNFF